MFTYSLLSFYSGAGNLNSSHVTEQRSRLSSQPGTVRLDAFTHCLLAKCAPEVRKWTPIDPRKYVHLPKAERSSFEFRKSYNCDVIRFFVLCKLMVRTVLEKSLKSPRILLNTS